MKIRFLSITICMLALIGGKAQNTINEAYFYEPMFNSAYEQYRLSNYTESFPVFSELAAKGYKPAFGYMGLAYEFGQGVEKNSALMCEWYDKAVQAGEGWCGWRLGEYLYDLGQYRIAVGPLKLAAQNGGGFKENANLLLGRMFEEGLGVDKDSQKAIEYYRKAALGYSTDSEAKDGLKRLGAVLFENDEFQPATPEMTAGKTAHELYELGRDYHSSSFNKDYRKAYAYFMAAAQMDYPEALEWMGYISTDKDYPIQSAEQAQLYFDRAIEGYKKRALSGVSDACNSVGDFYRRGLGRPVDLDEAAKWYKMGADQGNASSMLWLGQIYDKQGHYYDALQQLERAGAKGQGWASYLAGEIYENGRMTDGEYIIVPDIEQAVRWYEESAKTTNYYAEEARRALTRLGY